MGGGPGAVEHAGGDGKGEDGDEGADGDEDGGPGGAAVGAGEALGEEALLLGGHGGQEGFGVAGFGAAGAGGDVPGGGVEAFVAAEVDAVGEGGEAGLDDGCEGGEAGLLGWVVDGDLAEGGAEDGELLGGGGCRRRGRRCRR